MKVRCKFVLQTVESHQYMSSRPNAEGKWVPTPARTHVLKLSAVTSSNSHDSAENKSFWDATPAGSLEIHCASGAIAEEMAKCLGQTFYLDIEPAQEG
ncbi:MAG: hypothetical protein ACE15C_14555 [Phycisphaerae bacterium]